MKENYIGKIVEFTFPDAEYFSYSSPTGIGKIAAISGDKCITKVISPSQERGEVIPITQENIIKTIEEPRKKKTIKPKSKRKVCRCKK